jgi:hypothetical protein
VDPESGWQQIWDVCFRGYSVCPGLGSSRFRFGLGSSRFRFNSIRNNNCMCTLANFFTPSCPGLGYAFDDVPRFGWRKLLLKRILIAVE